VGEAELMGARSFMTWSCIVLVINKILLPLPLVELSHLGKNKDGLLWINVDLEYTV
jgi:hypothetical protein